MWRMGYLYELRPDIIDDTTSKASDNFSCSNLGRVRRSPRYVVVDSNISLGLLKMGPKTPFLCYGGKMFKMKVSFAPFMQVA